MIWKDKVTGKIVPPTSINERTELLAMLLTLDDVEAPGVNHFEEICRNITGTLSILTPKEKPSEKIVTEIAFDAMTNYASRMSDREWQDLKNNAGSQLLYNRLHEFGCLKKAIEDHIQRTVSDKQTGK